MKAPFENWDIKPSQKSEKSDARRLFPFHARTQCRKGPILLPYKIQAE